MALISDARLLKEFAEKSSESAFSDLVGRHLNLVYSAALRQIESPDAAADIAQRVFLALAVGAHSLAPKLSPEASIAGWLCRTTRNTALNLRREDARRRRREKLAMENHQWNLEPAADWALIRPILDEAMSQLSQREFDALVLRYFQNQDLRAVGFALGVSDDAAQKRIGRALDRLRRILSKRGLPASSSALAGVLSANAVQMAPAGLGAMVIPSAVCGSAAIQTAAAAGLGYGIIMTAFQKTIAAMAVAAILGVAAYQSIHANHLRSENRRLVESVLAATARADALQVERDAALAQLGAMRADSLRQDGQAAELMRLRGEVSRLKSEASKQDLDPKPASNPEGESPAGSSRLLIYNPYLARESWADKGADTPYHAFETMLWAGFSGNTQRLAEVTFPGPNSILPTQHLPIKKTKGVQIVAVDGDPGGVTRIGAIVEDEFYGAGMDGPPGVVQDVRFWYLVQSGGGWKVTRQDVKW